MQWYTRCDCHGMKNMSWGNAGTSSVNIGYRDDDPHDDDLMDFEDFEEKHNETAFIL